MNIELTNEPPNWLQQWRSRAGLEAHEADRALDLKPGTIAHYEESGFSRTPLRNISKLAKLYTVSPFELYGAVEQESQRIRESKNPHS
ncbi:MAG: helix-turn-helix transcriptional regulator [Bdellovibrionales bacterium]|nr:helix-turn-helix transcriptional regulator [Bdellovibrionales bacterium]